MTRLQFGFVKLQNGHELVVLNVSEATPNMSFREKADVSEQLPEPYIRRQFPNIAQQPYGFTSYIRCHGSTSPILGWAAQSIGNFPTTSTRINVPGDNLAIRVARVTPLYNTKTPSAAS
jgi:hypothetical protein